MSLTNTVKLSKFLFKKHPVLFTAVRTHYNKDYKPAPFPRTPEERAAAAEKYGLDIKDYKPFPDDGLGMGDYPDVKAESGDSRDPNYPWDNPEIKRNFNEPMHVDFDMMGEDRYDVNHKYRQPISHLWLQFLGVIFGTFSIYYFMEGMKMHPGTLPKQYPHKGQAHYSFELDN